MGSETVPRRLQIIITDEDNGEEVARANGVETMIVLIAPDALETEAYRHILLGNTDAGIQLLFDVFGDIADKIGRGTTADLTDVLDDQLLLEVTEGLLVQ